MPFVPIDISGGQVSGVDNLSPAASSVVNWDIDESGINRQRPGLLSYSITGSSSSPVVGLSRWSRYIACITSDRTFTYLDEASPATMLTAIGSHTLSGTKRPMFATGANYIYMTGGRKIHRWTGASTSLEELSSSPDCTHVCVLGQRLVSNDISFPGAIRWSDIGEGDWDTWPAANGLVADALPDQVVGLFTNTNELFVFGSESLQVFAVGVDPDIPFDAISAVSVGLGAPYCAVQLDENFAFLDSRRRIGITDGRTFTDISDAIHADLRSLTTISDGFAYREEFGQFSRLVFRFPTEGRTFVYDLKGQKWTERNRYVAPFQDDYPVGAYCYWPTYNRHLIGLSTSSGGFAELSTTTHQDLTGPLVCDRTTGWADAGTSNRKRSKRVRLVVRRGTASQGATPGAFELRVQNDDSAWSDLEQASVGGPGSFEQTVDFFLGGIFRRRRYQIRFSTSEETSLVALLDDCQELAN